MNFHDEIQSWFFSKKKSLWIKFTQPTYAFAYTLQTRINLINGDKEKYDVAQFHENLKERKIVKVQDHQVTHLFYEYTHWMKKLPLDEKDIIAIDIHYVKKENVHADKMQKIHASQLHLRPIQKPYQSHYKKNFHRIIQDIKAGKYYQMNFTQKWIYGFQGNGLQYFQKFLSSYTDLSAMAHVTYIPRLQKMYLSNSPESLFVTRPKKHSMIVNTFPIKGTASLKKGIKNAFIHLQKSIKDRAELDMITDLLRNDLNRIQKPVAQVIKRHFYFSVPHLLQQASWVQAKFHKPLSLWDLIEALFPGGSITGAPKTATIKRIQTLEKNKREFYCGSTILHSHKNCTASINIRSAIIDFNHKTISYHAGGGITLKSTMQDEWNEMQLKQQSFFKLWEVL